MNTVMLRREPGVIVGAAVLGVGMGLIAARMPLAGVGVIVAALVVAVVATRADLVLMMMIAALPWENKLHYPSATLSTVKGIGALVVFAYLLRILGNRRARIELPPLVGVVTALFLWVGLSFVTARNPAESTQTLFRWLLFVAFFFLIIQLVDGPLEVRRALRWFTTSVSAASLYALTLFLGHNKVFRAAGPLEDPNDFAYLLACTLPIAAYLASADQRRRVIWIVCFVLIAAAMLATFSRGALVGVGALLVWGIITRRIPLWVVGCGLASALVVVALAFTLWKPLIDVALHQKRHIAQANTESREAFWSAAVKLAERRPLTGVGPGRFPTEAPPLIRNNSSALTHPITHNTYLEILSEEGFPGLFLFVTYLLGVWLLLHRIQRRAERNLDRDEQRLATALQSALVIAVISGTFLSEELAAPFWLLGGIVVVLARTRHRPRSSVDDENGKSRRWLGRALPISPG
jgi:putative inorganic carbon (HCO3(-)) transporter